jgi:hypothetical protein
MRGSFNLNGCHDINIELEFKSHSNTFYPIPPTLNFLMKDRLKIPRINQPFSKKFVLLHAKLQMLDIGELQRCLVYGVPGDLCSGRQLLRAILIDRVLAPLRESPLGLKGECALAAFEMVLFVTMAFVIVYTIRHFREVLLVKLLCMM